MGKVNLTNFDFEDVLSNKTFSPTGYSKVNKALEFVFLWMAQEDEVLGSKETYSADYLDFIKNCRGFVPEVSNDLKELNSWWGNLNSKEDWLKEKEINSNLFAQEAREALDLNVLNSKVCHTKNEYEEFTNKGVEKWVLKENLGFSGRGLHFNWNEEIAKPLILEPYVNRVRDFGIRISKDDYYIVQNLIDKKGTYRGSLIKDRFEEESLILEESKEIFNFYHQKWNVSEIQIDSFQYLENGQLKYNPLCEVNHRKSMGSLAWPLHQKFGNEVSLFALVPKTWLKRVKSFSQKRESLKQISYNPVIKEGVIPLSPETSPFYAFFLTEKSERMLQHLVTQWWQTIALEELKLPPEFIVYF